MGLFVGKQLLFFLWEIGRKGTRVHWYRLKVPTFPVCLVTHTALMHTRNLIANLHLFTLDVHRRWFIISESERWKLECLYLSMAQFVSLVFKMSATELVSVGIELISLALAEECLKILEKRKKRRPRRWWVKPSRREQLGASTQLLVHYFRLHSFQISLFSPALNSTECELFLF